MTWRSVKKLFRKRYRNVEIEPDEILLDSSNLPQFDTDQFEGRLEKPISKITLKVLAGFFIVVSLGFISKVWILQVQKGEAYAIRSENNHLKHTVIFAERGVIYDRNNVELAWNVPRDDNFSSRKYTDGAGLSHILGYVKYPSKDKNGFYYREDFEGVDGIEKTYDERLKGENGVRIVEINALGDLQSEGMLRPPKDGESLRLSIDAAVEKKLYEIIQGIADQFGFLSGAGILMDVKTGELLAMASFPEYDANIMSEGTDKTTIGQFLTDNRRPLLNRITDGVYTPGSIVKPFMAIGVLNEKIIDPNKTILSTGSISLPNPYNPNQPSIFKDWKAHGWVDMRDAIAVSSNVYFYTVGGGFGEQKGIGISNIEKYVRMFGFGEKTGIDFNGEAVKPIPNPEWKAKNFPNDPTWRIGDTYNTVIGQYGFQVTPIQVARAVAAIANYGKLLTPVLIQGEGKVPERLLPIAKEYFDVVHEGMRQTVTEGSAPGLNISAVKVAAKTGTAQVGVGNSRVNSWVEGFFPYDNPRYSFAVVMERGPADNSVGAVSVIRRLLDWMAIYASEYLKSE
ncbi:MAG TPA: penicillin-binding transpeptidase domain-containing protein [Candidatus Paceibacterota bacterium]